MTDNRSRPRTGNESQKLAANGRKNKRSPWRTKPHVVTGENVKRKDGWANR